MTQTPLTQEDKNFIRELMNDGYWQITKEAIRDAKNNHNSTNGCDDEEEPYNWNDYPHPNWDGYV